MADLGGADGAAAELFDDGGDFAGGDALDIHFGQGEFEGLLAADAFFQGAGIEGPALDQFFARGAPPLRGSAALRLATPHPEGVEAEEGNTIYRKIFTPPYSRLTTTRPARQVTSHGAGNQEKINASSSFVSGTRGKSNSDGGSNPIIVYSMRNSMIS